MPALATNAEPTSLRTDGDPSVSVGELLRDHRRALGLTQEQLAERAGVSPRSISELERGGAHVPRRDTLALLARALGLTSAERQAFESSAQMQRARLLGKEPTARLRSSQAPSSPTASRAHHNLPRALTSFVGREQDLDKLAAVLATAPLLTLVGAGGIGKTRLAQEVVRREHARYADGCWLVELAGLVDPALVVPAVASVVGVQEQRAHNLMSTLTDYLDRKQILLVLDNCEHVLEACAALTSDLLGRCGQLHVLATSREPLAIAGETIWQVRPLQPPSLADVPPEQVADNPAVQLFLDRAGAVNEVSLTAQNGPAIARICNVVDGIPLAIELAAARTRTLSIEQLAEKLETDPRLLAAPLRVGLARHRTLRGTIDWSYDLLSSQEQVLLARLAVFAGGWTLETAEEVCSGTGIEQADILEVLDRLVEKSMVVVDRNGCAARYRLLEPLRQYASDRLESSGEASTYREKHAVHYLSLARSGLRTLAGPNERMLLERLEVEYANLTVALRWGLSHQQTEATLRSTAALFRYWERRGHMQEGCAWLEQALALEDAAAAPASARCAALNALAFLYWRSGLAASAHSVAEQALAVGRAAGDTAAVAQALLNLGMAAYLRHDHAQAVAWLEESVQIAREVGRAPMLSVVLAFLGRALLWLHGPGDTRTATVLDESRRLAQAGQSCYASGHALATSGDLEWMQARADGAVELWRSALVIFSDLADRRGIAGCLERLALALSAAGRAEPAAWLFGAADAQHAALGMRLRSNEEQDHAHFATYPVQEAARAACASAWSAGESASAAEAVARAMHGTCDLAKPG